jgi:peptidoglycan/xylan/chitin deacetylase (PgdA/CDA1 family)
MRVCSPTGCLLSAVERCFPAIFSWCVVFHPRVIWSARAWPLQQLGNCLQSLCCAPSDGNRTALTIDDFPSEGMTVDALRRGLDALKYDAWNNRIDFRATFFVIWSRLVSTPNWQEMIAMIVNDGHEIGVHYAGRWGWCRSVRSYIEDEGRLLVGYVKRNFGKQVRYVRPPGGLATWAFVDAHYNVLGLETVIGTGYAFDVDLCACRSSAVQGRLTAEMAAGKDNVISIFHDGGPTPLDLAAKTRAFVDGMVEHGHHVVTLDELLQADGGDELTAIAE